jgi:hypothetical protein
VIANLFGLRDPEELESNPIFLSYLPVTHGERVAWLSSRLRAMSWRELHELFPALMRIFSPGNGSFAYFSPSWTAFQPDGGRDFSVIVDGVSV